MSFFNKVDKNNAEKAEAQAPHGRTSGAGRLLITVYAVFAISASARAGYQIATQFADAPLAYLLSAFAAVVYIVATVALAKPGAMWARVATVAICIELLGVLVVGTLSFVDAAAFEHASVWSKFGQGYGYIPLLLPIIGLIWLRRHPEAK
ncbi:hypothetical protein AAGW05_07195 [Arthrobacter sp. LAPM80]|uniref:hypothetical protein n=1 Tax=Arthrobacter sp. LAPM80 TaxID=3141788 RepID=UPI00398B2DA6